VEKYFRTGQTTDDNMALVYCVLDTSGYKHILRVCNNYCFSTSKMGTRKRLSVTLYVHCLIGFLVVPLSYFLVSFFICNSHNYSVTIFCRIQ